MTTKVTITTHDWPVRVVTLDDVYDANGPTGTVNTTESVVDPHSEASLIVTNSRSLRISELPKPE